LLHGMPHSGVITVYSYVSEVKLSGAEYDYSDNSTVVVANIPFSFQVSPLVLDLNGDGAFDIVAKSAGGKFDMTNDGVLDRTSWLGPKDGFLAIDNNHNGVIDNRSELFGPTDKAADGFANLSQFDSNHDGVIDAKDDVFSKLIIWQDANQDGVS